MVIGVLCCFSIICLAIVEPLIFGAGMDAIENISTNIETETAPIESVLDSYMKYMLEKDTENAYALFSPRAQRQIKISKLQELLDNNYVLFENYESLKVYSFRTGVHVNINPDAPQGVIASATGLITYQDNIQRTFQCTLEKVDEKWKIDAVYITLEPNTTK